MTEVTRYARGTFCWADLATPNLEVAKTFYRDVLGWQTKEQPMGEGGAYTTAHKDDKGIVGLYPMSAERQAQKRSPYWLLYVAVDNADTMAAKAEALHGKVIAAPYEVMDVGRMAVLQDPVGGELAVWQPRGYEGSQLAATELGAMCWHELITNNVDVAGRFYCDLLGWKRDLQQVGDVQYTVFKQDDRQIGGMMARMGNMPTGWLVYFAVSDCDATAKKAVERAGSIPTPPTDVPEVGRFAILRDPQGAAFGVLQAKR